MNNRNHDFQAGVEFGGFPRGVGTAANRRIGLYHLQRHDRRQHDVHQTPVEQQRAVFHFFLDEPAALAEQFGAEGQFLKRLDIGEDKILPVIITELDAAVLHVSNRHAFAF